jgi:hypothetical protein
VAVGTGITVVGDSVEVGIATTVIAVMGDFSESPPDKNILAITTITTIPVMNIAAKI